MASSKYIRHVVLTGPPGVGKTTLVKKTCDVLHSKGIKTVGFYTEELRQGGVRTGFDVITLEGHRAPLARIEEDSVGGRQYKVGKYNVKLTAFEQAALPTLQFKAGEGPTVYIIDEVGKMEMFSKSFQQAVHSILDHQASTVLTTIPIAKGKPIPLVEEIRHRKDALLCQITKENRNSVVDSIVATLAESCSNH